MENIRDADLKSRWAARLPAAAAEHVAAIRLVADVQVCCTGDALWLQGPSLEDRLRRKLAALPGAERFVVLPDAQLVPHGQRVPRGHLPGGPWQPLSAWLTVQLPTVSWSARLSDRVALRLVRSAARADPNLLLTSIDRWSLYAGQAPKLRLDRWRFAAAAEGRVAIWGAPPPPLPGERLLVREGIGVPLGWTWWPAVDASEVALLLGCPRGELVIWAGEECERIAADQFVQATRSAVRLTAEELRHG